MIYSSKLALAKDNYEKNSAEILAAHPMLAQAVKQRKKLQMELSRNNALKKPTDALQAQLDDIKSQISQYVKDHDIRLSQNYSCVKCKDTGYINSAPCECYIEEYKKLLRDNLSLSPLAQFTFKDNTFAASDAPQAKGMNKLYEIMQKNVCENFANCKWSNFMLSGASGVGKTALATALADGLVRRGISALYLTAFELIGVFLDKHTHKSTRMSALYDYVLECEMLIVDNLGTEPIYKNVTLEYLYSTIEKRMAQNKKTLLCTQLGAQALAQRYGETFLSKFADKRYSLSVGYITGDNLRK